jgi:hypothetical protein
VSDFIEECVAFPNGAHDDQVDAMTQALLRWNAIPNQAVVYYNEPVRLTFADRSPLTTASIDLTIPRGNC